MPCPSEIAAGYFFGVSSLRCNNSSGRDTLRYKIHTSQPKKKARSRYSAPLYYSPNNKPPTKVPAPDKKPPCSASAPKSLPASASHPGSPRVPAPYACTVSPPSHSSGLSRRRYGTCPRCRLGRRGSRSSRRRSRR